MSDQIRELLWAVLLGIVEGVTEFLPISSTGHLLLCQRWMQIDLENDPFWRMFAIFIQFGAILAVVVYFRETLRSLIRQARSPASGKLSPIWLVLLATLPVLAIGRLVDPWVDNLMSNPRRATLIIVLALGIGGLLMLLAEFFRPSPRYHSIEDIPLLPGLLVGLSQVLAIIFPGTSRSAATILTGLFLGLSRQAAAELSFYLAIPVMAAASGYKLLSVSADLDTRRWIVLAVGTVVSFIVAYAVIAAFMSYIRRRTFVPFAIYRILLAAIVVAVAR